MKRKTRVLTCLREHGPQTAEQIAKLTGSSISDVWDDLCVGVYQGEIGLTIDGRKKLYYSIKGGRKRWEASSSSDAGTAASTSWRSSRAPATATGTGAF